MVHLFVCCILYQSTYYVCRNDDQVRICSYNRVCSLCSTVNEYYEFTMISLCDLTLFEVDKILFKTLYNAFVLCRVTHCVLSFYLYLKDRNKPHKRIRSLSSGSLVLYSNILTTGISDDVVV